MENQELAVVEQPTSNVIALTPDQQVEKASEMAKVLQKVVKQAGLARNFGGKKDHLEYEAWQTIAQFFNCSPVTEWTKPIKDNDKIIGWESRVNIVNSDGRVIGASESMCMRDEPNWKSKPNYALRSMSQTRAGGKAIRSVFAFVAVLAGYSATPSEEMMSNFDKGKKQTPQTTPPANSKIMSDGQRKKLFAMSKGAEFSNDEVAGFSDFLKGLKDVDTTEVDGKKKITMTGASYIFDNFDKLKGDFIEAQMS